MPFQILDCVLGHHDPLFRRAQLKALVSIHGLEVNCLIILEYIHVKLNESTMKRCINAEPSNNGPDSPSFFLDEKNLPRFF